VAELERSVLVVDDEAGVRELLRREIADLGHPVDTASDAREAKKTLARERHEIALVDIRLPDLGGVELSHWIKEHHPDTEVIFITAHATLESAVAAVRLGACDYLLKPIKDLGQIRTSLTRACQHLEERERARLTERALELDRRQLLALLELLPVAVVLLDRQGHVRGANHLGGEALRVGCGLRQSDGGKLECSNPRARDRLRALLAAAAAPGVGAAPRTVGGLRLDGAETGIPALVIALGAIDGGEAAGEEPTAALVLSVPGIAMRGGGEELSGLYGLTKAEAQVASALLSGDSVEDAALRLSITQATVRCHLRHIFAKTSTSRQGELMCLLLRGPALLCASAEGNDSWAPK
jgi:DNA-binding NarL/FixJ family response regulator